MTYEELKNEIAKTICKYDKSCDCCGPSDNDSMLAGILKTLESLGIHADESPLDTIAP